MKCTILDGPAAGEELEISRAPLFLRIAHNGICTRALDEEHLEPELTEIVNIYIRSGPRSDPAYRLHTLYPHDVFVMQNHAWRGWVSRQPEAIAITRNHR